MSLTNTLILAVAHPAHFFYKNLLPFCNFVLKFIHFKSVSMKIYAKIVIL